jgi:osmotically-inducible protein OsmY
VLNTLKWDAAIPTGTLDVTVSQGWVRLEGEVDHGFQKRAALRAICRLSGVKGITNLMMVKPRVLPSDLKQQIERALIRNAETDARNITVEMEGDPLLTN